MKWLLVSDLHYTLKQFDWVDRVAPDFEVVIIAGDHLDISSPVSIDAQIVVVLKYMARIGSRARLLVSSGNHDLNVRGSAGEKVARWMERVRRFGIVSDGDSLPLGETVFTVCPWWDGPETRKAVEAQLVRDSANPKTQWVWIYHSPPDASPVSWAGQKHFGDVDLVEWIHRFRPDLVLTGHIHQSPFRTGGSWVDRIGDTWVINSGRQIGPVPTHTILDMDQRTASWYSLAGTETVALDRVRPDAGTGQ